jgi:dolichyl-phosphate-mannose--protein O-mannosyl transferase
MFFMESGMNIIATQTTATNLALSNFLHLIIIIIIISLLCWFMRPEPQYRQSVQSSSMSSALGSYLGPETIYTEVIFVIFFSVSQKTS